MSRPFDQFVLKIHSRCNLACEYCYVYEGPDQSWRSRPRVMAPRTAFRAASRIAEHARRHELPAVEVVFHGGEPLLAGPNVLADVADRLTRELAGHTRLRLGVQTNGMLLDDAFLTLFDRWDVQVGVSIDGAGPVHDRRRRHVSGRGSHAETVEGLKLLAGPAYSRLFAGLLCVIDVAADPVGCYEYLAGFAPPSIDFLLPHATWDAPPPARRAAASSSPYADWLITVFDTWYGGPPDRPRVRIFEEIMGLVLGLPVASETLGLSASTVLVIEADGSVEQVDALKSAYEGAPSLGLNVRTHALDEALLHPMTRARQAGADALCETCRRCILHSVCGGGYFPHRYRTGSGFRNPSVYCRDLFTLITHIAECLHRDLAASPAPVPGGRAVGCHG